MRARGRQRTLGPQCPTIEQPSQDEEDVLQWSKELWFKITVRPCLQFISHTQPTTILSRIKCEKYFYKEVCSFVQWSSYILFDYVSVYICICICMQLYNTYFTFKIIELLMFLSFFFPIHQTYVSFAFIFLLLPFPTLLLSSFRFT